MKFAVVALLPEDVPQSAQSFFCRGVRPQFTPTVVDEELLTVEEACGFGLREAPLGVSEETEGPPVVDTRQPLKVR